MPIDALLSEVEHSVAEHDFTRCLGSLDFVYKRIKRLVYLERYPSQLWTVQHTQRLDAVLRSIDALLGMEGAVRFDKAQCLSAFERHLSAIRDEHRRQREEREKREREEREKHEREERAANEADFPPIPCAFAPLGEDGNFLALERSLHTILGQRGFSASRCRDCFVWETASYFWEMYASDVWVLGCCADGHVWFGAYERMLRDALLASLDTDQHSMCYSLWNTGHLFRLAKRLLWHFPQSLHTPLFRLSHRERTFIAGKIDEDSDLVETRAFIVALINAFVVLIGGGKPWGFRSEHREANLEPDVIWEQTSEMPHPTESPYHTFSRFVRRMTAALSPRGYDERQEKGSVSWKTRGDRQITIWKLCYYKDRKIRFGVREDLMEGNVCLRAHDYECRFYVPPDKQAIFRGFLVFDTPESEAWVDKVIACVPPVR